MHPPLLTFLLLLGATVRQGMAQAPHPLTRATVITEATLGVPLTRIGSVAISANGTIAMVLIPGPQLVILRGKAKPLFISRAGAGPGELRSPAWMGWRGDTLWVGDWSLSRVTLFTSDGKLIRSIPVQVDGSPVLLRDGSVAVIPMARATVDEQRPVTEKIRRVVGGKAREVLLSRVMRYRALSLKTPQGTLVGQQPFDDFSLWGSFGDGSGFVLVQRHVGKGKAPNYSVQRYSEKGKQLFTRAYPFTPVTLGDREFEAAANRLISELPSRNIPAIKTGARDALYRPAFLPTVSNVVAGDDGSIWLGRERTETPMVRWTLLDSNGRVVGDFLAPAGFSPRAGNATALWGVETDADGVPSVVELRVPTPRR